MNANTVYALTMAGSVYVWGNNYTGQYGDGTMGNAPPESSYTPVRIPGLFRVHHLFALNQDLNAW